MHPHLLPLKEKLLLYCLLESWLYSDFSTCSLSQAKFISTDWLLVSSIRMHPYRLPGFSRATREFASGKLSSPALGRYQLCRIPLLKNENLVVAFVLFLMQNMSWNFAVRQKSFSGLNIVIVQVQAVWKSSIYFPYETWARDKRERCRSHKRGNKVAGDFVLLTYVSPFPCCPCPWVPWVHCICLGGEL